MAYQSLLVQRRRALHRAVGDAIEELYADRLADHYEELAHHFLLAEAWAEAFDYLVRSGDKARDAYANETALDFYARALDAGARAGAEVPLARLLDVYRRRGRLWVLLSRYPEAIADLEAMLARAQAAGDRRAEGQALAELAFAHYATLSGDHAPHMRRYAEAAAAVAQETGDEHVLARASFVLGLYEQVNGELDTSARYFSDAMRIAQARGYQDTAGPSLVMLGAAANWRGDFPRAIELTQQAEVVAREAHDTFHEHLSLAFRCLAHAALGEYGEALVVIHDALAKARERNLAFNIGRLTNSLGWVHQEVGDFTSALEYDREGLDLGKRHNIPNVEISSLINLGSDHVALGQPRQALTVLEETHGRIEKAFGAHRWRWAMRVVVPLAGALLALGEPGRALEHVERGLALARRTRCLKYVALLLALRAEIALAQGDSERAEADAREALQAAQAIGYPTATWQTAHLLGRVLAARGRTADAAAALELAVRTLDTTRSRVPGDAMRRALDAWPRVHAALEDLERLRRA